MKAIEVVKSGARIVANAGLYIVGTILDKVGFQEKCNDLPVAKAHPENQITCGDVFTSAIGMMCAGNSTFESIREYKDDPEFYQEALGVSRFPSAERLRQRFDQTATEEEDKGYSLHSELREINLALLQQQRVTFSSLFNGDIPVDVDVTPYNESKSHKGGISRTYKGFDGYAPIDAHIGLEGYFINTEFREGKVHSQNGTPEFLIETIDYCNRLTGNKTLLFRLDSGNDAAENVGVIMERGHHFIIKRNIRQESKEAWLDFVEKYSLDHETPREGKDVYIGSAWKTVNYKSMNGEDKSHVIRIVYEVTKRTIDKHQQYLIVPDIEVNTWWDNTGCTDREVIELYHQHGTMEQYHSELKSDMDMEKLPSGKYATNRLIHELSMIAYNILRLIGDLLCHIPDVVPMRNKATRRRFRTVIINIIHTPARVISHAGKLKIDLGNSNVWADAFICVEQMI